MKNLEGKWYFYRYGYHTSRAPCPNYVGFAKSVSCTGLFDAGFVLIGIFIADCSCQAGVFHLMYL